MYLDKITLSFIQPCTTDSLRIRIKATTSRDISDIFPFLNTYLKVGIYNKKATTFTFNKEDKIIIMYKDSINVSKLLNETDAFEILDYIKDLINKVDKLRDEIKPSDEIIKRIGPLEVYTYLPKLNCGKCSEMTCLAFASKLVKNEVNPKKCFYLYEKGNEDNKEKIETMCLMLGNNI